MDENKKYSIKIDDVEYIITKLKPKKYGEISGEIKNMTTGNSGKFGLFADSLNNVLIKEADYEEEGDEDIYEVLDSFIDKYIDMEILKNISSHMIK
jgi:hypothetical protein